MAGGITGIIGIMNNYFAICNRFSDDLSFGTTEMLVK